MDARVEELRSTAKQYIEILKRCNSPEVKNWGKDDLTRVFQWCKYFNEVYAHISKKRSVIQSFDEKLKTIGYSMAFRCGRTELSAQFLSKSSEYLVKALLENPALPQGVRDLVLGLEGGERHNIEQHLHQVSEDHVVLSTLQTIHSRLLPHCPESYKDNMALTDARCVYEDLLWCLQSPNPTDIVHRRLKSLSQQEGGMKTILDSFLIQPEDQVGSAIISWVLQLLRRWKPRLEAAAAECKDNVLGFWKDTPPPVLVQVSSHSEEFSDIYLTSLSHWAKHIGKQSPAHSCDEELSTLIQHFHTLAKSSPKLKDLCIQVIASHFDMGSVLKGESQCVGVWGQLMTAVTSGDP